MPPQQKPSETGAAKVAGPFALVVLGVWAVVALVSAFTHDYEALSIVTPVMVIVAGAVMGIKRINKPEEK